MVFSVSGREKVKTKAPLNSPTDPILLCQEDYNTGGSESVNMGHKQCLTWYLMHKTKADGGLMGGTGCNGKDKMEVGRRVSLHWM